MSSKLSERLGSGWRQIIGRPDYWHDLRRPNPLFRPGTLEGYPNDLTAKTRLDTLAVDAEGIPVRRNGTRWYAHPVTVCQMALGFHDRWLASRSEGELAQFARLIDWLHAHALEYRGGIAWPVETEVPLYRLGPPFVSALVQGQAISALARAVARGVRADASARLIQGACHAFTIPVNEGGILANDEFGVAFEEYPTSPSPSLVLNGLISSLWGLADAALMNGPPRAAALLRAAVEALERRMHRYDLGYWSRYCLFPTILPNVASPHYHREHVAQLAALHQMFPLGPWDLWRQKWEGYQRNAATRLLAIAHKAAFVTVAGIRRAGAAEAGGPARTRDGGAGEGQR